MMKEPQGRLACHESSGLLDGGGQPVQNFDDGGREPLTGTRPEDLSENPNSIPCPLRVHSSDANFRNTPNANQAAGKSLPC